MNYLLRSGFSWSGHERNNLFVNLGDGTFEDVSHVAGVDFADDARGVAAVDWDADGDLDLWLNNRSSPKARLMRNEVAPGSRWLSLALVGSRVNRDAVGARAELKLADGRKLIRTVRAGVNYTVQGSKRLHFGLGDGAEPTGLTVRWPDGSNTDYEVSAVDRSFRAIQGDPRLHEFDSPRSPSRLQPTELSVAPGTRAASVPLGVPLELPSGIGMTAFDGKRHVLAGYRGTPLLVNVWASWCGPCRTEFEDFAEYRKILAEGELSILACSVDETREAAVNATTELDPSYPTGMCDDRFLGLLETVKKVVLDRYDDLLLPTSLLIDGEGRLARIYIGPIDMPQLADDVESLEAATTDLDLLQLAALGSGGRWERPDVWITSHRGRQLLQMTRFLTQDNRGGMLADYAGLLADFLEEAQPPQRALQTSTDALLAAARAISRVEPESAIDIYREALVHRGDDPDIHRDLAWALLETGHKVEASRAIDRAVALASVVDDPQSATIRGLIMQRLGQPARAAREFERARALDPEDLVAAAALDSVRAEAQRKADVLSQFEAEAKASPSSPDAALQLAVAFEGSGRSAEAKPYYERFLELAPAPTTTEQRSVRGRANFRLERWAEAAELFAKVVEADGDSRSDREMLGLALARMGRDDEARRQLEAAQPEDAAALYVLGLLQARTRDLAAAATSFEHVLRLEPERLEALRSLALARDALGEPEASIALLQRYLQASPEDSATRARLGKVQEAVGRVGESIATYRTVVEKDPSQNQTKFRLAWLLATSAAEANRDGREALRLAQELNASNPPHPALLDLLGAAHAEMGQFDEAQRLAGEAVELAVSSGDEAMATEIRLRLDAYRGQRAFHTPA